MTEADPEADPVTNHHDSITDLRQDLMAAVRSWSSQVARLQLAHPDLVGMNDTQKVAYGAALMASSYAYTLAAALKIAEQMAPASFANHLAFEVAGILGDGDFEDYNADIDDLSGGPQ